MKYAKLNPPRNIRHITLHLSSCADVTPVQLDIHPDIWQRYFTTMGKNKRKNRKKKLQRKPVDPSRDERETREAAGGLKDQGVEGGGEERGRDNAVGGSKEMEDQGVERGGMEGGGESAVGGSREMEDHGVEGGGMEGGGESAVGGSKEMEDQGVEGGGGMEGGGESAVGGSKEMEDQGEEGRREEGCCQWMSHNQLVVEVLMVRGEGW